MDMSKDPAMKGMDMNHSKMEGMEKDDIARSKWICPRSAKEGMEMDHSNGRDEKDDMQEEVVTADSAKKG
jgi:hypothetical protein